jgi:hypothetical protein
MISSEEASGSTPMVLVSEFVVVGKVVEDGDDDAGGGCREE